MSFSLSLSSADDDVEGRGSMSDAAVVCCSERVRTRKRVGKGRQKSEGSKGPKWWSSLFFFFSVCFCFLRVLFKRRDERREDNRNRGDETRSRQGGVERQKERSFLVERREEEEERLLVLWSVDDLAQDKKTRKGG